MPNGGNGAAADRDHRRDDRQHLVMEIRLLNASRKMDAPQRKPARLAGVVGRPGGAQQMANAVEAAPTGILGNAGSLAASAQAADKGANLLSSLLGGGALG